MGLAERPRAVGEKPPNLTEALHTVEADVSTETPGIQVQPELTGNPGDVAAVEFISEPQRKRLFALMKQGDKTKEQVSEFLASVGIASSKDIPTNFYSEVEAFILSK